MPLLETVMVLPAVPKTLTEHDMAVPTSFKSHITGRAEKDEQDSSDKPHSPKLTKKKEGKGNLTASLVTCFFCAWVGEAFALEESSSSGTAVVSGLVAF